MPQAGGRAASTYGDLDARLGRVMPGRDEWCRRFALKFGSGGRAERPGCMLSEIICVQLFANCEDRCELGVRRAKPPLRPALRAWPQGG